MSLKVVFTYYDAEVMQCLSFMLVSLTESLKLIILSLTLWFYEILPGLSLLNNYSNIQCHSNNIITDEMFQVFLKSTAFYELVVLWLMLLLLRLNSRIPTKQLKQGSTSQLRANNLMILDSVRSLSGLKIMKRIPMIMK